MAYFTIIFLKFPLKKQEKIEMCVNKGVMFKSAGWILAVDRPGYRHFSDTYHLSL